MENLFTHWESVINFTRNDIVFERHNKEYGAYAIRKYYPERLRNAFIYSVTGMVLLFAIPLALQKLFPVKINVAVPGNEYVVEVNPVLPEEKIILPAEKQPIKEAIKEAVKFIPPTVVNDNTAVEPTVSQQQISEAGIGTSFQLPEPGLETVPGITEAIDDTTPRILVSEMPTFIGGEEKLFEFLRKNLRFPGGDSEGTIYVSFVINKYGKVKDVNVIRGLGRGFDEEAVRVVRIMPDWNPGRQNGSPVAVQFRLPIKVVFR